MSLLSFAKKVAGREQHQKSGTGKASVQTKQQQQTKTEAATSVVVPADTTQLTPLVTEKSVGMQGNRSTIAFRVRASATKPQIAAAVAGRYSVVPLRVRTIAMRGKMRRRGQTAGVTADWKKAYVTLPEGASIDLSV